LLIVCFGTFARSMNAINWITGRQIDWRYSFYFWVWSTLGRPGWAQGKSWVAGQRRLLAAGSRGDTWLVLRFRVNGRGISGRTDISSWLSPQSCLELVAVNR
jgi:hypothetical protein